MPEILTLTLPPQVAFQEAELDGVLAGIAARNRIDPGNLRILKRSLDARGRQIRVHLQVEVCGPGEKPRESIYKPVPHDVSRTEPVIIVGAGPAGLFAALRLIERGRKPVILERGKEIPERKKDIALLTREHKVDPDSNYCFGEGGAGTFSDGKLYTRSKKRGDIRYVLEVFYHHGAPESILYDAHPHIGTDLLPRILKRMRETIVSAGGSFHFRTRVTGILGRQGEVQGVVCHNGKEFIAKELILATGHSARDVYAMLASMGLKPEAKDFAVGVRVEHPQEWVDRLRYHRQERDSFLPPAWYQLTARAGNRGVFTFCMCPGGFIVPSATGQEELVVNGMSPSRRNSPYANSGVVAEVRVGDLEVHRSHGVMAGLRFQEELERVAWKQGGRSQVAPAQRLVDFLAGRESAVLPSCSYMPGITSSPLHRWLPVFIRDSLREGFLQFDRRMRGFISEDALILGVESRTSSPVRIPRDETSMQHPLLRGLFPAGEGAGYAGGLMSSAIDGMNCAEKCTG